MRNGDFYKIKSMHANGTSAKDICHQFRNRYSAAEVKRFLPPVVSESETPKPKAKARRRKAATE